MFWKNRRPAPPGPPETVYNPQTTRVENNRPALTPSEERAIARSLYPGVRDSRQYFDSRTHTDGFPW